MMQQSTLVSFPFKFMLKLGSKSMVKLMQPSTLLYFPFKFMHNFFNNNTRTWNDAMYQHYIVSKKRVCCTRESDVLDTNFYIRFCIHLSPSANCFTCITILVVSCSYDRLIMSVGHRYGQMGLHLNLKSSELMGASSQKDLDHKT